MHHKKKGILKCRILGYTAFWLDVSNLKNGSEACIFLNKKMSEKMKIVMDRAIKNKEWRYIVVEKMSNNDPHYRFIEFCHGQHIGHRKKIEKQIALDHEVSSNYNPARSKSNRSQAIAGRTGLISFERTGNKISRALSNSVDDSI